MKLLKRLQASAHQVVELTTLTSELHAAGQLPAEERFVARIRKVRAGEIVAAIGTVPLLFSLARERLDNETAEEFEARMRDRLLDDPLLQQAAQQQQLASQTAVVALGVTAIGLITGDSEPEWEDVTLSVTGGEPSVTVLGGSLAEVHDAINAFGSVDLQRLGGTGGTETFPAEPTSTAREPSSDLLRDDADGVPQPASS